MTHPDRGRSRRDVLAEGAFYVACALFAATPLFGLFGFWLAVR